MILARGRGRYAVQPRSFVHLKSLVSRHEDGVLTKVHWLEFGHSVEFAGPPVLMMSWRDSAMGLQGRVVLHS